MSKQTKKSQEQLSPQSPAAPAGLKKFGHQHGSAAHFAILLL